VVCAIVLRKKKGVLLQALLSGAAVQENKCKTVSKHREQQQAQSNRTNISTASTENKFHRTKTKVPKQRVSYLNELQFLRAQ
jgi:hypothetical protein